jgi:hypothetical protein
MLDSSAKNYRRRSVLRPHLPSIRPLAEPPREVRCPTERRAAPLSSELWHHTAYPVEPEATWAQPLIREELS